MRARPVGERFGLLGRGAVRLLSAPDVLVDHLVGAPVELDGRVLDRRVQFLIRLAGLVGRAEERPGTPDELRRELRRLSRIGMPTIGSVHSHGRVAAGPGGRLPMRVYRRPDLEPDAPAVVFLHGGGWAVGDLDTHDGSCRLLADEARCVVVAVDYRLAPEHPFPAAVDDAVAGYAWVLENATSLGADPSRVAVMGDSAGGNLAAVVSQQAAVRGLPTPVAQGLVYPATDAHFGTASYHLFGTGFFLSAASMDLYRRWYLPDEADWSSPLASPLLAEDLHGQPPTLVATAGFDPLRDEGDAYADRLREAGVHVLHRRFDDQVHGFFGMGVLPGGMARNRALCADMGRLLRGELKP